jgi:hypothetical protein
MSWGTCSYCGQKIIWGNTFNSGYQPFEPDGSGRHQCGSGIEAWSTSSGSRGFGGGGRWRLETLGHPLTYPTTCWWCGEMVFFHTNGNGDCVLFDELGWPWQVHICWERHRNSRSSLLSEIENRLREVGYNGLHYTSEAPYAKPSKPDKAADVTLTEYIVGKKVNLESLKIAFEDNSPTWIEHVIRVKNEHYQVLIPLADSEKLDDYSIVEVTGQWLKIKNTWLLLIKRLKRSSFPHRTPITIKIIKGEGPLRCSFCGCVLNGERSWGFNARYEIECEFCYQNRTKKTG